MERSYGKFAQLYDKLTFDVLYREYADFIELMIKEHGISPELVFDLACGTGTMAGELSSRGYDMIASDASEEMLGKAIEKYGQGKILFLNQPMQDFELFGTVDVIICMLDSINYLTEKEDLDKTFALCSNYLNDGGLLLFDVNSEYKFKNILKDNTYTYEMEDIFYVWENNYNDAEKLCDFFLTFFRENENGLYERIDEHHIQRCYSDDEIKELLLNNGFTITGVYDGYSKRPAESDSQRILYSAVRRR